MTGGMTLKLWGLSGDTRESSFMIFSRSIRMRMSRSVPLSVDVSVPADSSTTSEYLKPIADNLDNKQVRNEHIKNACRWWN